MGRRRASLLHSPFQWPRRGGRDARAEFILICFFEETAGLVCAARAALYARLVRHCAPRGRQRGVLRRRRERSRRGERHRRGACRNGGGANAPTGVVGVKTANCVGTRPHGVERRPARTFASSSSRRYWSQTPPPKAAPRRQAPTSAGSPSSTSGDRGGGVPLSYQAARLCTQMLRRPSFHAIRRSSDRASCSRSEVEGAAGGRAFSDVLNARAAEAGRAA